MNGAEKVSHRTVVDFPSNFKLQGLRIILLKPQPTSSIVRLKAEEFAWESGRRHRGCSTRRSVSTSTR